MRLHKFMAACGVGSRRYSEILIKEGRVIVNGHPVIEMGTIIDPMEDIIVVDGKPISLETEIVYILLYKTRGTVTTVKDPYNRKTVLDLLGPLKSRIYPVGRLDYDTEGLLILTNDGAFAAHLTHPSHAIDKEYDAVVRGQPGPSQLNRLRQGIDIGGFITSPAAVQLIERTQGGDTYLSITIHEGKNRQVRRMFEQIGHPVITLRRVRIGPITLDGLQPGAWRHLTAQEIIELKQL